jgi:phage major head subunit gpT-like protein
MPNNLPVVNPSILEKGLRAELFAAYEAGAAFWPKLAMRIPSTAPQENYGWLGTPPSLREWTDERVPRGLLDHKFTIVNKDWEATIAVDRNAFEDDQTGQLALRVRELGERAKRHPDELISKLLADGESAACYDGQFFFDTDHSEGDSGGQSNDLTFDVATPSSPTAAEFAGAFKQARKALRDFKDDRGMPFNLTLPNPVCMVPTSMEAAAEEALHAKILANNSNALVGAAELMVNPLLSNADRFYLFVSGNAIKPLIFQERRGVTAAGLRGDGEDGFFRKTWHFGVDARYNVGYGLWQYAVLTTLV